MNNSTETEIRFFFNHSNLEKLIQKLQKFNYLYSAHEITILYDNPNPNFSFYNQKIDGRLRLRLIEVIKSNNIKSKPTSEQSSYGLITWKRRLPEHKNNKINIEEEIEYQVSLTDFNNVKNIFENILKCPRMSSYERIRHNFDDQNVKITLDEFPYGLMLEFELKNNKKITNLMTEIEKFNLTLEEASRLSCDDKYHQLCQENNQISKTDILFSDKDMPLIK